MVSHYTFTYKHSTEEMPKEIDEIKKKKETVYQVIVPLFGISISSRYVRSRAAEVASDCRPWFL